VVAGRVEADGREYGPEQMLVFAGNSDPVLTALETSTVMLLGGEPLGPRHIWWNFVSSRRDRIKQARADWQNGRIHLPLNDDQEFIPLPEDPIPAPEPMS
jgi:redox-sensitive bicupin YhaK (pirin superfamily)